MACFLEAVKFVKRCQQPKGINSGDSWLIFNLRKNKRLLLHGIFHDIFVHGKRSKEVACCCEQVCAYIGNLTTVIFGMLILQQCLQ
jgi:hypothetical protein